MLEKGITVQCTFHQCMLQVCAMNGYGYVKIRFSVTDREVVAGQMTQII